MTMIHHDGSELHVPDQSPAPGSDVEVFLRTSPGVQQVHVRSVLDGEPRFSDAVAERRGDELWWRATIPVHNPVTPYRFLVDGNWFTATGPAGHEVADTTDFRLVAHPAPPAWIRDAVIYQIFPDRFARSAAYAERALPPWAVPCGWDAPVVGRGELTSRQIYGGDLDGIAGRLDHIQSLGADTVYLTPFFPAGSNHRYDASTFDTVDPLLGGDAALARLADALHARGMRLVGDITTNHTGDAHEWFHDPAARDRYYHADDGTYAAWYGVPSLPKLNWNSTGLRKAFVDPLQRWLEHLDGWRVDVANMTGRHGTDDLTHEVSRLVARAVRDVRPDAMLVAEHAHGAGGDLDLGGWQGTMNYAGFTRPLWTWLRGPDLALPDFLGVPGGVPTRGGDAVVTAMRAVSASMSWRSWTHSWTALSTHDTPRVRTVVGDAGRVEVAAGLLATLPGVPMLFAGDEIGLTGAWGEESRQPMPWHDEAGWDHTTLARYRALLGLRRAHPALRHGGMRVEHADADAIAFWRETASERLLVFARRASGPPVDLPLAGAVNVYGGAAEAPADGPTFQVWQFMATPIDRT
ncbi:glycoside hydrolase family 13 protein [Dactylosporangium sp. CA-152071]|uniref:glycoside hydrolase family 13 protein n=1 Tax=Dactylosporangium sp. CA-152071 TaxID=3239933 RepID=UPI003D8BB37E